MPIQQLPGTAVVPNSIGSSAISTTVSFGPKISAIAVTDSGYTVLDDTAVSVAGGYIKITGTGFVSGCTVIVGSTAATAVSFVDSSQVRAQVPALAAGTYIVYVVNPDGSVAIRVNSLNVSAMPSWTTASPLAGGVADSAISIQLVATSNSAVTFALQAGSTLPAGLTLTSGGLLAGTVTGLAVETVYNFTIVATDAELQDTPQAFSITISVGDSNFKSVTTLLSASTPTTNPFATDASTNNFAITVAGDTRPNNFGPYTPGYYSGYFDGSGDQLNLSASAISGVGSSNFSIECWVFASRQTNTFAQGLVSYGIAGNTSGTSYLSFQLSAAGTLAVAYATGSALTLSDPALFPINQWAHAVVCRSGSTLSLFVNGNRVATASTSATVGSSGDTLTIGGQWFANSADRQLQGYLSNVRIVNGASAYDATQTTITVPTNPLTAITNTSLLTCQSNRFIDNSTNNFTITRNGDTLVSGFDPFLPNSSYSTYGSTYFDGTGDRLTLPSSSNLAFGAGDFCVEAWTYFNANPANMEIFANFSNSETQFGFRINESGYPKVQSWFTNYAISSVAVVTNQWYHLIACRVSNTLSIFINGARTATATVTNNFSSTDAFTIGGQTNAFNGYISNLRVTKGSSPYDPTQTTITVPATPLTAIANTQLLTCQSNQPTNNSMFVDSSTSNFLITRNGNTTQGAFTPYAGVYSVNFPNSSVINTQTSAGAYLRVTNTAAFDMGTGDFTLEGWIYPQSLPSSDNFPSNWWQTSQLFGRGTPSVGDGYGLYLGATRLIFQNSDSNITNGLHGISVNNWYHVAACRSSGTLRLFVNGVQVATTSFSSSVGGGSNFYMGTETGEGAYFNGYMSNIRVLKGTALYTAAFTPATAPLTPIANTQLLTCADNRFLDDSGNGYTVTPVNSPTVQRFGPFAPQLAQTPTSYSVYFDGNGDYLAAPNSALLDLGSNNFTIEAWIFTPNGTSAVVSRRDAAQAHGWVFSAADFSATINGSWRQSAITAAVTSNVWFHAALVRNGSQFTMYHNGVSVGTYTAAGPIQDLSRNVNIAVAGGTTEGIFTGYLSNVRMVIGTAVYTSNFTPSTTPLTAIANTSLLTCQSTTIRDSSTNNFAITANGDSRPVPQNPIGYTNPASTAYTPATYGGSAYFDGSGDYLSIARNSAFLPVANEDFTIEAWIYLTATPSGVNNAQIVGFGEFGSDSDWSFIVQGDVRLAFNIGGTAYVNTTVIALYTWSHVVVSRSGTASNNLKVFVNGIGQSFSTNSTTVGTGNRNLSIGADQNGDEAMWPGYISDIRITKGQALYTSNFVPPQAPLVPVQNSVLLLNMNNAAIYDSSMLNDFETVGNAQAVTAVKKYGNTSIYFDGTGDYLQMPASVNLLFSTGDYTIEGWINPTSNAAGGTIISSYPDNGSGGNWIIWFGTTGKLALYQYPSVDNTLICSSTVPIGSWTHFAVSRASGTTRLFINGVLESTIATSYPLGIAGNAVRLGMYAASGGSYYTGYLDDLRITRGVARYTSNFTPTTSPLIRR